MAVVTVEELEARNGEIAARLKEIDTEHAGDMFPDDTRAEWNDLYEEQEGNSKRIAELNKRTELIAALGEQPESREDGAHFQVLKPGVTRGDDIFDLSTVRMSAESPDVAAADYRDRAKRFIERAKFPHENAARNHEGVQGHVERLLTTTQESYPGETARYIVACGSELYRRAFWKSMANTPLTTQEQRALSLTGASGGFAVPTTLDPSIIPTSNSVVNPARAISRIVTISGSNTWNGVSSGAITAARVAEATAGSDNAPTLAQPTVTVTKAHATIPYSYEIIEDWVGMESEIAKLLQDAKDDEEATAFVTGAGSGVNPQGFVTGTTNTVAAAAGLTITAANLYALEAALPPRFRPNESFVANRGIYNVVRGIDTSGGPALWLYLSQGLVTQTPSPGNTGALLLGRGAWEASTMQATVVNATKIMVVGDFNYFVIVDRIGMQILNVPVIFGASQGNLPSGQGAFYAFWRNSSKVLSASAFVALTGTT